MRTTRRFLGGLAAALIGLVGHAALAQQAYPSKPVKIVVPYPPGGPTDITARVFAQGVSELIGQPVVIENKPGAGTNLGAEYAARSAPDGYTLYVANFASHAVNRHLFRSLAYHPINDFTPVSMMVRGPMFLCTKLNLGVGNVKELIELARKSPGKLTYGSPGNGSPPHLSAEYLKHLSKTDIVHVPYRGSADMIADLLAGQIDFLFDASVIAQGRAGKVKCIGVGSDRRWPTDPEIATLQETGLPEFSITSFFGIVAPAKTPPEIAEKLNGAFRTVAERPETAEKLKVTAVLPFVTTVKETAAFLAEQDVKWEPIIKASGAKVD